MYFVVLRKKIDLFCMTVSMMRRKVVRNCYLVDISGGYFRLEFVLKKEHAALEKGKGYVVIIMHTLVERIHSQFERLRIQFQILYVVVVFYGTFLIYIYILT